MNLIINSFSKPINLVFVATLSVLCYSTNDTTIQANEFVSAVNTNLIKGGGIIVKQADARSVNEVVQSLDQALGRVRSLLDETESAQANNAVRDAIAFFSGLNVLRRPWITVTDMGIAAMQWQSGDNGLLLMFTGDGTVSISRTTSLEDYSSNSTDYPIGGNVALLVEAEALELNL
jgi:hypothetical protein